MKRGFVKAVRWLEYSVSRESSSGWTSIRSSDLNQPQSKPLVQCNDGNRVKETISTEICA